MYEAVAAASGEGVSCTTVWKASDEGSRDIDPDVFARIDAAAQANPGWAWKTPSDMQEESECDPSRHACFARSFLGLALSLGSLCL